jgi:hypothetical protein
MIDATVSFVGEVRGTGAELVEVKVRADPARGVLTVWRCSLRQKQWR